jgi:multidrug efflux pump subunit AcrA (membrane-fusion protein)
MGAELTGQEPTRVQPGMEVQISAPSGELVKAKVRSVAPTVDLQTRNGLAYVDIPSGNAGGLKAGMFARGELILDKAMRSAYRNWPWCCAMVTAMCSA